MELTGRLTADAFISTLKDERQVVNFTLAINDYYKPKDATEGKQFTQFVKCSYWKNATVAQRLTKGAIVEISGRLFTSAYVSRDGEARAALNAICSSIKVHGTGGKKEHSKKPHHTGTDTSIKQSTRTSAMVTEEDGVPF